jgi:hypothetical protein
VLDRANCLVSRNEFGSRGESVVNKGVSQVVGQVLKGTLSGDDSLDEETKHGEHSKTSVLDLLDLELSKSIGVVSKTQGVESLTGVEGVETLTSGATVYTVSFNETHEDNLGEESSSDGLGMDKSGVTKVVEATILENGGTDLEPDGLTKVDGAVALEEFRGNASKSTEHGPASVDDLELAVAGEGLGVSGHTGGIPAVVTGILTLEVRDLRGEGSEELGAISTVELGAGSDVSLQEKIRVEKDRMKILLVMF